MKKQIAIISRLLGKDQRTTLIRKNILASVLIKGWSSLVLLLLVPLTIACLGSYKNGVWLTMSSVLLWINSFDIGLGNGLRNKLALFMAHDQKDEARATVSSALAMLVLIIIPVTLVLVVMELNIDCYSLFNVDKERIANFQEVLLISTIFVCTTFSFKFVGNVYMGLQLPAVNNLLLCISNTMILIVTFVLYKMECGTLMSIAFVNTAAPLLVYLVSYPITFCGKYRFLRPTFKDVHIQSVKELFRLGLHFFILQTLGIVLLFSANLIISKMFSPEMVTPYQIAYRYIFTAQTIFTIVCVPYWTATTDAYAHGDYVWMKRAGRTLDRVMMLLIALISLMVICSDFVYDIWIQGRAEVPFSITLWVALYSIILICSSRYSFVLNGVGALKLQLLCTFGAAVVYVPLAVFVGRSTGSIDCLLAVMCAVNIPGLIVNYIQYRKIINGKAKGIWTK